MCSFPHTGMKSPCLGKTQIFCILTLSHSSPSELGTGWIWFSDNWWVQHFSTYWGINWQSYGAWNESVHVDDRWLWLLSPHSQSIFQVFIQMNDIFLPPRPSQGGSTFRLTFICFLALCITTSVAVGWSLMLDEEPQSRNTESTGTNRKTIEYS